MAQADGAPGIAGGREALVVNVYTEKEFRRLGLARRLMTTIIDWSRLNGSTASSSTPRPTAARSTSRSASRSERDAVHGGPEISLGNNSRREITPGVK